MTHPNLSHIDDTTTGHDLTPAAGADLDHQEEGTAIIPILQITNIPGVLQDLPGGNDTELIEAIPQSQLQIKFPKLLNG